MAVSFSLDMPLRGVWYVLLSTVPRSCTAVVVVDGNFRYCTDRALERSPPNDQLHHRNQSLTISCDIRNLATLN